MKNWKTTLAGFIGGVILAFGPNIGGRLTGDPNTPPITLGNYLPLLVLSALGLVAKDHDVTGGVRPQ